METKRLTATEREAMVRLYVAMDLISQYSDPLKERAKLVPWARRDLGMIKAAAGKLIDRFTETVPADQMMTFVRSLQMASYTIGVKAPGAKTRDDKTFGMWLPYEVLNGLLDGCKDHCDMCSADKNHRMSCKLRKTMDKIPNDAGERPDGDCPYFIYM